MCVSESVLFKVECPDLDKLHFELYGKLHMPDIPVRLGGNYHDFYDLSA